MEALNAPRAAVIRPPRTICTPSERESGSAACANAEAMLAGPSACGSSAGRCAPVKTTGRGSAATRSARKAVSSIVSVPWVTTTPSMSGSASASAIAATTRNCSVGVIAELSTDIRSTGTICGSNVPSMSAPCAADSSAVASRSSAESTGTAPSVPVRAATVPPVVIRAMRACGVGAMDHRLREPADGVNRCGRGVRHAGAVRRFGIVVSPLTHPDRVGATATSRKDDRAGEGGVAQTVREIVEVSEVRGCRHDHGRGDRQRCSV